MAIIENAELWFAKLDPARPDPTFDKDNPSWQVQIRTADKKVAKQWKDMNLNVRPLKRKKVDESGEVIRDDFDEPIFEPLTDEKGRPYFAVNLSKKLKKKDNTLNNPVKVMAGDLSDIDPRKIGNGSVGNVRVYQYETKDAKGEPRISSMLMSIQVTLLKEYEPRTFQDEFTPTKFKVIKVADNQDEDEMSSIPKGKVSKTEDEDELAF